MYNYSVGFHSYDDHNSVKLTHKKKFTQEEFEEMVIACTVKYMQEQELFRKVIGEELLSSLELDEIPDDIRCLRTKDHLAFEECWWDVAKLLSEDYGFKYFEKSVCSVYVFGFSNLLEEPDYDTNREADDFYHKLNKAVMAAYKERVNA